MNLATNLADSRGIARFILIDLKLRIDGRRQIRNGISTLINNFFGVESGLPDNFQNTSKSDILLLKGSVK